MPDERIRATEKKLREVEAAGVGETELDSLRRELDALRGLPQEARVFLQGSGEDSVIIGFSMPEIPIRGRVTPGAPPDPRMQPTGRR